MIWDNEQLMVISVKLAMVMSKHVHGTMYMSLLPLITPYFSINQFISVNWEMHESNLFEYEAVSVLSPIYIDLLYANFF